ncbi:MAG: site-specific integrase [Candidatus Parvarchaeota archaeon]
MQITTPEKIVQDAGDGKLKNDFMGFVRNLQKKGEAGSYIIRFKKVLSSWVRFNDISFDLKSVKIKDAFRSPTIENERVPSQEELARIIRSAPLRNRVSIALMAFSGLRIETIGNYKGTDGLLISDLPELKISDGKIEFEKISTLIKVRSTLSKARHEYITFLPPEGIVYIKEYLESRINNGERITQDSPLVAPEGPENVVHERLRTQLISREIRKAIRKAGFNWRPYVLRAYFSTALDVCENKGLVSHNWREYWTGHKGDISARYSTNKKLTQDKIEEMRSTYLKCTPYLETQKKGMSEEEKDKWKTDLKREYLRLFFDDKEIDDNKLLDLSTEDLQKKVKEKIGMSLNNGHSQKVISMKEVKQYIEQGWEFVQSINSREAIVRIPR